MSNFDMLHSKMMGSLDKLDKSCKEMVLQTGKFQRELNLLITEVHDFKREVQDIAEDLDIDLDK